MTDELIDILNKDYSFQKTALKSEAHKYGWLHASVHIWFYTETEELLLQKRSATKIAFPNVWDVSVAGHIGTKESPLESALREIKEEIGLEIEKESLKPIGTYHEHQQFNPAYIDNELHYIYKCKLEKRFSELKIQKEELTALKLIPIKLFRQEIKELNHDYAKHPTDYYLQILNNLEQ
ncbi:NUDIX hydrolase [Urechidicola vernalis]|uniref:NUDIX domain-containing protein n=1 Tax=Urechidicola vernalis TaxID=3075600 RepID=A0ABU2Y6W7_9FLAO|nr:NUDIX domain-containing protein [Urechidicola sp. P050]MDT0553782.1 NUDIX domain-containing protein [Urechidicola sp. P050]